MTPLRMRPKNLGTKLLALGLTLLVSGLVYLDQQHVGSFEIPIRIEGVPPERVPLDDIPERANIRLLASGRDIVRMWLTRRTPEELAVVVAIPDGSEDVFKELKPADVTLPPDVDMRVTEILQPERVSFRLDELATRELPVVPRLTGAPPSGFVVNGDPQADPPVVMVSGPSTLVRPMTEVQTAPIDLSLYDRPFNAPAALVVPEKIEAVPLTVQVHGDIEAERQDRLDGLRVVVRNARGLEATVDPPTGSVTLLGPESRIERLRRLADAGEPTGLVIAVEASGKGPGAYEVTPVVELADDLRLVSVAPPRVQLILEAVEN